MRKWKRGRDVARDQRRERTAKVVFKLQVVCSQLVVYKSQNSSQLSRSPSQASDTPSRSRLVVLEPKSRMPWTASRPRVIVLLEASASILPKFSTIGIGFNCSWMGRTVSRHESRKLVSRPPSPENISPKAPSDWRRDLWWYRWWWWSSCPWLWAWAWSCSCFNCDTKSVTSCKASAGVKVKEEKELLERESRLRGFDG